MTGNSDEYVPTCLTRRNSLLSRETSPEKRDVVDMWFDLVLQSGYHAGEIAVVDSSSTLAMVSTISAFRTLMSS